MRLILPLLFAFFFAVPAQAAYTKTRCLVAIGDSLTSVEGSHVENLRGWETQNIATGGSQTAHWGGVKEWPGPNYRYLHERFDEVTCDPQVVTITLGTNDAGYTGTDGIEPIYTGFWLHVTIKRVRDQWPGAKIMLNHPTHRNLVWSKKASAGTTITRRMDEQREHRVILDEKFTEDVCIGVDFRPLVPLSMMPDNVHPNEEGQAIMRKALQKRLRWWRWCR
jgi:lysophospholipase L1-like esterase